MRYTLVVVVTTIYTRLASATRCLPDREIVNKLGILHDDGPYDRHKVPELGMTVLLGAKVQTISGVNDVTRDFVLDVVMAEAWMDGELAFRNHSPCRNNISFSQVIYNKIWTPNTCFINSKHARIHRSPFENIFIMILESGVVWTQYRAELTGPCEADLTGFPMDLTRCYLTLLSFAYSTVEVRMRWVKMPIVLSSQINLPDFDLVDFFATTKPEPYPAGTWDELTLNFILKRKLGWYLLNVYAPTYLTLFISWVSFSLGPKAIPARTMVGVNSLLALTFQFGNVIRSLPRVSYVKAIDVWMLTGMTFVFASLLELAYIGWRMHMEEKDVELAVKQQKKPMSVLASLVVNHNLDAVSISDSDENGNDLEETPFRSPIPTQSPPREPRRGIRGCLSIVNVRKVDRLSSVLFPFVFAVFNIFYWTYYRIKEQRDLERILLKHRPRP